jgi:hypothetical protein
MTESEFEKSFQKSKKLVFYNSEDYKSEPPAVCIVFDDAKNGIEAYDYLRNNLTKDEICLTIRILTENTISITLIDKKNSKFFNIDNLNFDKSNYDDFRLNSKFGKYCMFCIAEIYSNQPVLFGVSELSPLLVSELIFSQ